jgi:hypothetical protein
MGSTALAIVKPKTDKAAVEIGKLWRAACSSLVDSGKYYAECGLKLVDKKASLKHGEWMPWLKDNEETLGFKGSAARYLTKAANCQLAGNLDEASAVAVSRKLWGHKDSALVQQSLSNEHYTPSNYLDAARGVFGGMIDLDPASCAEANNTVQATTFFSIEDDGLARDWSGRVWLNPPYGRLPGNFVSKFIAEFAAGHVKAGIILVNAHCTDTDWFQPLWNGVLCFTDHRINFYGDDERSGSTHGSVFVYFGPDKDVFARAFATFGAIVMRVAS